MGSSILFLLIYWSILVLPGLALSKILKKTRTDIVSLGALGWIATSYTLYVLVFCICNYLGVHANTLQNTFFFIVFSSLLILLGFGLKKKGEQSAQSPSILDFKAPLFIIVISGIYQLLIGSYNEIPADLYNHLGRFQAALRSLEENSLGQPLSLTQLLTQKSGVFYYFAAFASTFSDASSTQVVELVDFSNRTFFLVAVFCFAKRIFRESKYCQVTALLCLAFLSMHMGISVFSYIRYYSFAPSMLALILYFCAIAIGIDYIEKRFRFQSIITHLIPIALLTLAAAAVHTQEAMFIGIMALCISIAAFCRSLYKSGVVINRYQSLAFSILAVLAFVALFQYSIDNLQRAPNAHWRLWDFGEGFWFLPQLTVLNLKNQFIQVVTLWGLLVYTLFFLNIKKYKNNLFLIAGMLSPLLTFLNPFFIDTFLRHYNSTTVWRLCYLLPIHFVAADLFVNYLRKINSGKLVTRIYAGSIVAMMVLLLLPILNTWQAAHFSRAPTIGKTNSKLGYDHYLDLVNYLNSIEESKQVLTDPMLGYMISGLTRHEALRQKFTRGYRFKRFSYYDYSPKQLDKFSGHLLISNTRQNTNSKIGRLARHWSENEWINTKNYYPEALFEHLSERPDFFKLVWSSNGVNIYEIGETE